MAGSDNSNISRHDFDTEFVFGAATSAYQIEGGYKEGGKAFSIWDTFSITKPAKISDGSNGCLAIDHYNKFKEDIDLMKKLGLDAYRLSFAWTRILPGGRLSGGVNREGVKFYNDVIDYALSKGIQPYVTIFHWDIPTFLQEEYGGFASPKIVQDFAEYAEVCFFEFGDRVKHWITINESWTYTHHGYISGDFPPNHGSYSTGAESTNGAPTIEKKIHRCGSGVDQTVNSLSNPGTEPYEVAHNLILAHAAAVEVYRRDYQEAQKGIIGVTNVSKWFIPLKDTKEDKAAAARAVDFMWGWFIAPIGGSEWLFVVPKGFYELLVHTYKVYDNPLIFVTENGLDVFVSFSVGARVKGYFVWSLLDNYEWAEGYTVRFGMIYVDYGNGLTRYPKSSAIWFMNFLSRKTLLYDKRQVEEKIESVNKNPAKRPRQG
ncbi:hypothetical protein MIMGU_mgv1a023615mg [Erythranthe guttata]|uniref:Beta-glucosidase n=1 Tax=Erythranthe guttata TaxID=4155 RepID=A0A022QAL4_ERYGU|nr:hypothetical protein MIMGU_mgv1a023615mg [Erythranthe guttata]